MRARFEVNADVPLDKIGTNSRAAALVAINLLGLKANEAVKHPDFIDGGTVETLLATVIAAVAQSWWEKGMDAGVAATLQAHGGRIISVRGETQGNAAG